VSQCVTVGAARLNRLSSGSWISTIRGPSSQELFPAEASNGATERTGQPPAQQGAGRRDLRAYLSLPLEAYSLLDPRYIARLPAAPISATAAVAAANDAAGRSGSDEASSGDVAALPASGAFLLTVPLTDIVGLELTPQLVINVDVDERKGQVGAHLRHVWEWSSGVSHVWQQPLITARLRRRLDVAASSTAVMRAAASPLPCLARLPTQPPCAPRLPCR
jgi:hypothetical protein